MGEGKLGGKDHEYQSHVSLSNVMPAVTRRILNRPHRDESEIASVEAASADDVDKAVAAARKAFKDSTWRDMASTERGDLLYKLSQLVEEHKETLATIETWDNGIATYPTKDRESSLR
jgi:acyl-CoA reductase-like NAD-dependent aldehyde dehydrogenase